MVEIAPPRGHPVATQLGFVEATALFMLILTFLRWRGIFGICGVSLILFVLLLLLCFEVTRRDSRVHVCHLIPVHIIFWMPT